MKRLALLLLGVTLSTPADACHRFSYWAYDYPQRCGTTPYVKRIVRGPAPTIIESNAPKEFHPAVVPEIPLPDMSATWNASLTTPAELDLSQGLLREKAKRMLYPQQ